MQTTRSHISTTSPSAQLPSARLQPVSAAASSARKQPSPRSPHAAQERRYQRAIEGWLASRIRTRGRAYRRVVIMEPGGGVAPT